MDGWREELAAREAAFGEAMAREDAEEADRIARRPLPADAPEDARRPLPADAPEDARRPWGAKRDLARMAAFGGDV